MVQNQPAAVSYSPRTRAEAEQVVANLQAILAAAGAALTDVARVGIVMLDLQRDQPVFNQVWAERFGDHRPARSAIQAPDFGRKGENARFMIEVTAYRGDRPTRSALSPINAAPPEIDSRQRGWAGDSSEHAILAMIAAPRGCPSRVRHFDNCYYQRVRGKPAASALRIRLSMLAASSWLARPVRMVAAMARPAAPRTSASGLAGFLRRVTYGQADLALRTANTSIGFQQQCAPPCSAQ